MKYLIIISLLMCSNVVAGQQDTIPPKFKKSTGIDYYDKRPEHVPYFPFGTEIVFVKRDTTFYWHDTLGVWYPMSSGNSGNLSEVDWEDVIGVPGDIADGDDVGLEFVARDTTLVGQGTAGQPLGVRRSYIETIINDRIEVEFVYEALASSTSIVLPNLPDTRYPIQAYRGLFYSVDRLGGSAKDFGLNGSTLDKNYGQVEAGHIWTIFYVKQQ